MSDDVQDRVYDAVVVLAALGLLARLVGLGARTFHWDEGRVGYWTLRYFLTGVFEYRPVAGGPFLYVVNNHVFALLGVSDFTARLVVAVIGGLLPLVALLFRDRLRPTETVGVAFLLAANPLLLYYSRFVRGDVILAAAGLVFVGSLFRFREHMRADLDAETPREASELPIARYLYAAAVALGVALASSAFVGGYLVCWLLAGILTFDHHRLYGESRLGRERVAAAIGWIRERSALFARAGLLWAAVVIYFFAPRAGSEGGPGLWKPLTWPSVLEAVFVGVPTKFYGVWIVSRGKQQKGHALLPYVSDFAHYIAAGALVLVVLGLIAFALERYGRGRMRPIVAFHAYWAGAGLLVFPIITEVSAPWVAVHVVAPLSVPAAVGLGKLLRIGRAAFARRQAGNVAAVVLVLLALGGQMGAVAATDVYGPSEPSNDLAHYAQPADDLDPFVADVSAAIAGNQGIDVVYFGEKFYVAGDVSQQARRGYDASQPPLHGNAAKNWGNRLPLPWYLERLGADTASVTRMEDLNRFERTPPVVIADASDRNRLASRLSNYRATEYRLALWNRKVVVFVRT